MSDSRPILYSFRRCPYAMRARMAIIASGHQVELREVILRDKPEEMLQASPKATVPVLVKPDQTVVDESLDVMLWALEHNDPDNWLNPENREPLLAFIEEMDGPFKEHLDKYKYATRHAGSEDVEQFRLSHRAAALDILRSLDARLSQHKYLFSDRITLADIATFPFVRQFANTDRDWFDQQQIPNVQNWLANLIESDLFATCMNKYDQWKSGNNGIEFPPPQI